jgi:hypothetical protein
MQRRLPAGFSPTAPQSPHPQRGVGAAGRGGPPHLHGDVVLEGAGEGLGARRSLPRRFSPRYFVTGTDVTHREISVKTARANDGNGALTTEERQPPCRICEPASALCMTCDVQHNIEAPWG